MAIKIFHNPRCTKSRQTLSLIEEKGIEPEIIEYLKEPPSKEQLKQILSMLNMTPRQLMRTKEKEYREKGLDNPQLTEDQLIDAMINTPKLIERPIVICEGKAAIGRPPEKILEILSD